MFMKGKNHALYCYVFRTAGDLAHCFPFSADTAISSSLEIPMLPDKVLCFARQQDFYTVLSPEDAAAFAEFCRSRPAGEKTRRTQDSTPRIPSLLLFPETGYARPRFAENDFAAVFSERYTSQLLARVDPLPGAAANLLGQKPLQQLRFLFPGHHLILSLLFSSLTDLYSAASPVLAEVPPLVRELLSAMEAMQDPVLYTDTLPFLKSYQTELKATDTPLFLDLAQIVPRLAAWLPQTPLFSGLTLQYLPGDSGYTDRMYQVRFPVSAFTYIFVLLSYMFALLSDDSTGQLTLYRSGTDACLTFQAETDRIPGSFTARSELYSLSRHLPGYTGLLTLTQYLLHRSGIPFTCSVSNLSGWPVLELTLRMDTRFREEIEFRCGDVDALLSEILPDALALLQYLTAPPSED